MNELMTAARFPSHRSTESNAPQKNSNEGDGLEGTGTTIADTNEEPADDDAVVDEFDKAEEELDSDRDALNEADKARLAEKLQQWLAQVRKHYTNGVDLIKINVYGEKYVRKYRIIEDYLCAESHANAWDKSWHVNEIETVGLGAKTLSFDNLKKKQDAKKDSKKNKDGTRVIEDNQCAYITFKSDKPLSLAFADEAARNAFVYLLRVVKRQFHDSGRDAASSPKPGKQKIALKMMKNPLKPKET
eukprot:GHVU01067333.1.p1 GENE.GHVU01067333.1~~GHVU01067333.1.p1  ORF type:complete len:245 (-),score=75.05 GHVU01067333.1:319-1053(-)